MIFPEKHINCSESLLGFGAFLLTNLTKPKFVDELWRIYH